MKKSSASLEASPYKSVAEELEHLRKTFRSLSQRYTARIDAEIVSLRDVVLAESETASAEMRINELVGSKQSRPSNTKTAAAKRAPKVDAAGAERQTARFHDLRDMLTLLRTFEVTSGVARRKDLKKVETVLEELQLLASHWT